MTKNWANYLNRLMGERSQADFARFIGVSDGQLSKWRNGQTGHKVETVIDIARRLGDSPLHALAEVGYLEQAEIARFKMAKPFGLDDYSDLELSQEIVRRVTAGTATSALTDPIELEDDGVMLRPVVSLPARQDSPEQSELREVAADAIAEPHPEDIDSNYDNS